jgi:hypothetical protein
MIKDGWVIATCEICGYEVQFPTKKNKIRVEKEAISELLGALKITPEPSKRLDTLTLTGKEIAEMKKYFGDKKHITAKDISEMLFTIYDYAVGIKDNKTISKVSVDILTLLRLTRHYDGKGQEK